VRGCGQALEPQERSLVCARGHAFVVARSGYVNLLQPHDRRSLAAGDARETVAARLRLHERGVGRELVAALVGLCAELRIGPGGWILEVGCGPGAALAELAAATGARALGVDLSVHAIDAAAKRNPACTWIVANADRGLPVASGAVRAVVSIAGPKNPAEFARVLARDGRAIVGVPGPADLVELRASVLGAAPPIERAERTLRDFAHAFELVERRSVRSHQALDARGISDLLAASYRGARRREAQRAAKLEELEVTLETELLVLARRADTARSARS
jgi:23S rRNA (guanine745-N1)-methyltransferase